MLKISEAGSHLSLVDPNAISNFEDFVLFVAENIFVQALGRPVTDSLVRNFQILDPALKDPGSDRLLRFQALLKESFGEFHASIMQIIVEEVCALLKVEPNRDKKDFLDILEELKVSYRSK